MKKAIAVICAAALILTLSAAAFAADDEADLVTGATVKPDKTGVYSAYGKVDLDELVREGVISQETCDIIKDYLEEKAKESMPDPEVQLPDENAQDQGQNHGRNKQPRMSGQKPGMNSQEYGMNGQEYGMGRRQPEMNRKGFGKETQPALPETQEP